MFDVTDENAAVFLAGEELTMLVFSSEADVDGQAFVRRLTALEPVRTGRLRVGVADVDAAPRLASAWGVTAAYLPIQLIFHDGILQRVLRGTRSDEALSRILATYPRPSGHPRGDG